MKKKEENDLKPGGILFVSTYPPRKCGIATFTKDLISSVKKTYPYIKTKVLAVNRNGLHIYNYPKEVALEINDVNVKDYIKAAEKINEDDEIKIVCIQHEFNLFGGQYGRYLLKFLINLKKPVIIAFHSVNSNPNKIKKKIVKDISKKVNHIVVMTKLAASFLRKDYGIKKTKISVIPHGVHEVPFKRNAQLKSRLGYKGRTLLTTFGFVEKRKGQDIIIKALPKVVKEYPNVLYLVIGETPPLVRRKEGEKYKNYLEKEVKRLGLQKNVRFYDKYVSLKEILKYLTATDIYLVPSRSKKQVASGTISYALGSGRVVISTPSSSAKSMIRKNMGIIVNKFNNPNLFSNALLKIMSNPLLKKRMEENAYASTRHMTWINVGRYYKELFDKYDE